MPREKSDSSRLWDMLSSARAVATFVRGRTLAEYESDLFLRSAVERQLEIIGEAAGKISASFCKEHPDIPWSKVTGQRHMLIHDYGEIKAERIWLVATVDIPALIAQLEPLVSKSPDKPA